MNRLLVVVPAFAFIFAAGCGTKPAPIPAGADGQAGKSPYGSFIAAVTKLKGTADVKKNAAGHEYLLVEFHQGTDADLQELRKALAELPIPVDLNANLNGQLTDAGLPHLKGWKTLSGLGLGSPNFTDAGLANLADLDGLESLYIYHNDQLTDAALVPISKLKSLRELSCDSKKLTQESYANIAGLTKLEKVRLGQGPELGDAALAHIANLHQLRELHLGTNKLTDAGFAQLKHFPELRTLQIEEWDGAQVKATSRGLANLSHLGKLETLRLKCAAAKEDLSALKNMKELHSLTLLMFGGPKAGTLGVVAELPKLKTLSFGYGCASDESLKGIEGAKVLEVLELSGNDRIDDEGCKTIGKLTTLKRLTLGSTKVTDAGLSHLKGLTGLQELDLRGTKVTPAGIGELKKSLPQVKIDT